MKPEDARDARFAMRLSLAFGVLMLAGKLAAYWFTGSTAILSDAAESVIHVVAVAFANFSLHLSLRPANDRYLYGYERITFFSAGFEGAMIIIAAIFIIVAAIEKWMGGLRIERLGLGTFLILVASVVNALLGWYLVRAGRRSRSLILEANGKHVLTDSWTSFGVVAGLTLVLVTGYLPFDPVLAIIVAVNILWSGGGLVWNSARGLLDYSDPETGKLLRQHLDVLAKELGIEYHGLRFRSGGRVLRIDVHLLFPFEIQLGEAHRRATVLEERLALALDMPLEVVSHLEAMEDHSDIHRAQH